MKLRTFLWVAALSTVLIACGDDDSPNPSISFENAVYEATFRVAGATADAISTSGGITPADVALAEGTDASVSYNTDTGLLEWSNELPLDETSVTLVANSGSSEITTTVMLNNSFVGTFLGSYTNGASTIPVQIVFGENESDPVVTANELATNIESWERTGYDLRIEYTVEGANASTTFVGIIEVETGAVTGDVFDGENMDVGDFSIDLNLDN